MRKITEYLSVYAVGAGLYSLIEILWRGFTHWTMALTGGAALVSVYAINTLLSAKSLFAKCIVGGIWITLLEFLVGLLVNRRLHMGVWDYSGMKFNILGQICPLFTFFWCLLCIPAVFLCNFMKRLFISN